MAFLLEMMKCFGIKKLMRLVQPCVYMINHRVVCFPTMKLTGGMLYISLLYT